MFLEVPDSITLKKLDEFLRAIWLECCGHLSAFEIHGQRYEVTHTGDKFFYKRPKSMQTAKLEKILRVGDTFSYEYDFGTTTMLNLKVVNERVGYMPDTEIRLLARNFAPVLPCKVCKGEAKFLRVSDYPPEPYCEEHSAAFAEDELLPVVNSPRVGECAYKGPFDPSLMFKEKYPKQS